MRSGQKGFGLDCIFALIDWHHPDFPKYGDRHHPMRNKERYKDAQIDFDRYLDFMHGQVKELVTNLRKTGPAMV